MPFLARRRLLQATSLALTPWLAPRLAGAAPPATPPPDLALVDLRFPGDKPFVKRATVLVPTHLPEGQKVPTLVLFHGFGEAKAGHEVGAFAWLDRYGAASSYGRLQRPPVSSIDARRDLREARAAEINERLTREPFGGLVLVCPFTPNVWGYRDTPAALDALADFVAGDLLDQVARQIPCADTSPARTGVDGCSLGGYVSAEVFARKAARFGAFGVIQPAIERSKIGDYVGAVARRAGGAVPVHVETSTGDPYLGVSRDLQAAMKKAGLNSEFIAPPGPHDQLFLRDVGCLEFLLWHDRTLRGA